jgi:hypothetical protein
MREFNSVSVKEIYKSELTLEEYIAQKRTLP